MSPSNKRLRFFVKVVGKHRVVHLQSDEPTKWQVVVQLLHQHPLAADAAEVLQEQRAQQTLRRNRRTTHLVVHPIHEGPDCLSQDRGRVCLSARPWARPVDRTAPLEPHRGRSRACERP